MMDLSKRRGFLKGFGLIGAVAAGVSAPVVIEKVREVQLPPITPTVDPKIISQIEEINPSTLSLAQTYGEIEPPKPPPVVHNTFGTSGSYIVSNGGTIGSSYVNSALVLGHDGNIKVGLSNKKFVPGTEKHVDVKLVPGPDGELYLNINGQWKKVLTV
jgi:hypothetical protein